MGFCKEKCGICTAFFHIYTVINNKANVTVIVGIETIAPYLMKSMNENLTSCSFNKLVNMIPANAPIGVKKAPKLLPMIEANTPEV